MKRVWQKIAIAVHGEEACDVVPAFLQGAASVLQECGLAEDKRGAAVQLAVILVSPSEEKAGSLMPALIKALEESSAHSATSPRKRRPS